MTITTIDITEEELKTLQQIQQLYGLSSVQEAIEMLSKQHLENVRYQITGDIGQPIWVAK